MRTRKLAAGAFAVAASALASGAPTHAQLEDKEVLFGHGTVGAWNGEMTWRNGRLTPERQAEIEAAARASAFGKVDQRLAHGPTGPARC